MRINQINKKMQSEFLRGVLAVNTTFLLIETLHLGI